MYAHPEYGATGGGKPPGVEFPSQQLGAVNRPWEKSVAISAAKAKPRARIAGLKRAVRNGERPANCPELTAAYRELAVVTVEEEADTLAAKAAKLVADWPDLNDEQLGRIAGVLKAAGASR